MKHKDYEGPIQICLLYCEEKKMILDLEGLKTELFIPKGNGVAIGKQLRALCGQHILMRFGLPLNEGKTPVVILIPDVISLARYLGKLYTYQLLFNWKGESKVGEAVVVRYSILS